MRKPAIVAIACAAMLACVVGAPVFAKEVKAGGLVISQAWARATPKGAQVGGGYLTITNTGKTQDTLIGGLTEVAASVQVHEMSMQNGVMKMRRLENGLTIAPGKTVKLAPSGYHLMLTHLKQPLKQGGKLPITLQFKKAGNVTVSFDIEGIGAQGPARTSGTSGKMKMNKTMKM
ncbi:MAG: copper chaperone PCu(A)C [Bradyrhizobium sp.]